jgi:quercetin dioxygenase-like cupin family protein
MATIDLEELERKQEVQKGDNIKEKPKQVHSLSNLLLASNPRVQVGNSKKVTRTKGMDANP